MTTDSVLAQRARGLYSVPAKQFVSARATVVAELRGDGRADDAKAAAAMRKPSGAAAAVNLLSRTSDELLVEVVELGYRMRDAQTDGDGAGLRELGGERRRLIGAVVEAAGAGLADVGDVLSPAARSELEDTLQAAMSDDDAARAVRSGLLVTGLRSDGFGPVDLEGALALPDALGPAVPRASRDRPRRAPAKKRTPGPSPALTKAEQELAEARQRLDRAVTDQDERASVLEKVQEEVSTLERQVDDLRRRLADTVVELRRAETAASHAEREHDASRSAVERAAAKVERLT